MTSAMTGQGRHTRRRPGDRASHRGGASHGVILFARARSLPQFCIGLVVAVLLAWWAGEWLSSHPEFGGATARVPVVALAPLVLSVLVSMSLYAADEELERTGARAWRRLRGVVVVALTAVGAAGLAVTALEDADTYGAIELVRNSLACVGMVALAGPIVGGRLAWSPAFVYVATAYITAPRPLPLGTGWWTWPVQSSPSDSAWWAAAAWFVVGVVVYARWGSRPRRWDDT